MNIREKENELFDEWEKDGKWQSGFARDGVVSEKDYLASDPKVVFILKEVNGPDGDSDLREYLQDGAEGGGSTWNNIVRWGYGIQNRNELLEWKEMNDISDKIKLEEFQRTCVINLKKSPGKASADWEKLVENAKKDSVFIQKQYALYNPDIILCCGSGLGDLFREVVQHVDKEWKQTSRGVWWYEREPKKSVIEINHPQQYSVRSSLLFYELIDAVNEIYAQQS